jgi:alpha-glucosidase
MDAVMRFWLDRGVDGFRIDVASGMIHDRELRDEPRVKLATGTRRRMQFDQPEVLDVHRRFRRLLDSYGERMAVAEIGSHGRGARYVAGYSGEDLLHLSFNFALMRQPWRAEVFRREVELSERYLPEPAWPTYTMSNHDAPRAISRYGDEQARVAALMLLTLRGTPFIYYGEEIGMHDVEVAKRQELDVADRDRARSPMQWDSSAKVGFTAGRPWLPVGRDRRTANVTRQQKVPRSMLSLYRQVLVLRRRSPALRGGSYRTVRAPDGVWAYVRESAEDRWLVALNFRGRARRVDLSRVSREGVLALSTGLDRERGVVDLRELRLGPDEGVLLRIR